MTKTQDLSTRVAKAHRGLAGQDPAGIIMAVRTSVGSPARYAGDNRAARLVRTVVELTAASLVVFVVGLTLATGSAAAATGDFGPLFAIGGDSSGVSCSDALDCTAVGGLEFAVSESGGVWGAPAELSGSPGGFTGVSCTGAGDCTAVGDSSDSQAGMIYATESGGTWGSVSELSFPPGAQGGHTYGVSCPAAGDCTAVGVDGNQEPVSVTETNGTWEPMTIFPAPMGYYLQGVSCAAVGDCTAVGTDAGGGCGSLYAIESGGVWGPIITLPDSCIGGLVSVSCAAVGDCTAVGGGAGGIPYYVTESNGSWGPVTPASGTAALYFTGVSCSDAVDCTAVGGGSYAVETNGIWGQSADVSPPSAGGTFTGVSCTAPGVCTAVTNNGLAASSVTQTVATHSLTVALAGSGSGSVSGGGISCPGSCSRSFPGGTVVTLTASPGSGSTFTGWSGGGCAGTGTCTVTLSSDQSVTATFAANPASSGTLTVALAGSGSGSVSGGGISCPGSCSRSFPGGTRVTLTASPGSGSTFTGWSGGGCSGTGTCPVTLSSDQSVTATFTASPGGPASCPPIPPPILVRCRGVPGAGPPRVFVGRPIVIVPINCGILEALACRFTFTLTVQEWLKGGKVIAVSANAKTQKRTVTVGTKSVTLAAGHSETVRISLDAAGQRLLKSRNKLSVKFTTTARRANGTMVAVSRQTIEFKAPSKKRLSEGDLG